MLALGFLVAMPGCSTKSQPVGPTAVNTLPTGGGGVVNGKQFASVVELAHHYNEDILAPSGLPLGDTYAIEGPTGSLLRYGYDILGELGGVNVYLKTTGTSGDFGIPNDDYLEIRRTSLSVHGASALLIHLQYVHEPRHDRWQLIWPENGRVVEVHGATAETGGHGVTPGPDVVMAVASAISRIPVGKVDTAGILPKGKHALGVEFEGQVSTVWDIASAQTLFGDTVGVPAVFSLINVFHSGWLKSYTVDIDAQGTQRVFLSPESPADVASKDAAAQPVSEAGGMDVFVTRTTPAGSSSSLFFSAGGRNFMVRDANGGSAADLGAIALSIRSGANATAPVTPALPVSSTATPTLTPTATATP